MNICISFYYTLEIHFFMTVPVYYEKVVEIMHFKCIMPSKIIEGTDQFETLTLTDFGGILSWHDQNS